MPGLYHRCLTVNSTDIEYMLKILWGNAVINPSGRSNKVMDMEVDLNPNLNLATDQLCDSGPQFLSAYNGDTRSCRCGKD